MRHQVKVWSGIRDGWQCIGRPKTHQQAERLRWYVERIRPEYCYRVDVLPLELPTFI